MPREIIFWCFILVTSGEFYSAPRLNCLYQWSKSHSVMSNSLWPHGLCSPWNSLGQNTGVGSLSLLQRIFPIQGLNPGLLHCRQILYQLSHKGGPNSGTRESAFPRVSSNLQWYRICFQTENTASVISNPLLSLSKEYQRFIILLWNLRSWSGALKDKLAFREAVHL